MFGSFWGHGIAHLEANQFRRHFGISVKFFKFYSLASPWAVVGWVRAPCLRVDVARCRSVALYQQPLGQDQKHIFQRHTSSTARCGAEVALAIYYQTFLIYRTCMRRAPARPVHACFVRNCCTDVVQEHDLRATPAQCNTKRTLSSHFTAHHTSHLHFTLHTSYHLKSRELFSPHLSVSHLIPSLLTCHMSSK